MGLFRAVSPQCFLLRSLLLLVPQRDWSPGKADPTAQLQPMLGAPEPRCQRPQPLPCTVPRGRQGVPARGQVGPGGPPARAAWPPACWQEPRAFSWAPSLLMLFTTSSQRVSLSPSAPQQSVGTQGRPARKTASSLWQN